jgi:hypothetical protein
MALKKFLNKENLHHAYLIEGDYQEIILELNSFLKEKEIEKNNLDLNYFNFITLKIDDAFYLKSILNQKKISSQKRIIIIHTHNFLLEAQNTLLKIFEEPNLDTHLFLIMPNASILLKTLFSRFYFINNLNKIKKDTFEIQKFISLSLKEKLILIKDLIKDKEENPKATAFLFLNSLESYLNQNLNKINNIYALEHIIKVREYLYESGSSLKNLMESVAIVLTNLELKKDN